MRQMRQREGLSVGLQHMVPGSPAPRGGGAPAPGEGNVND
eukprot:gene4092-18906_t